MKSLPKILFVASVVVLIPVLYLFVHMYFVEIRPRTQFPVRLQKRITPSDLQAWAMKSVADTNSFYDGQSTTNLPLAFQGLWIHEPRGVMYYATPYDTAHIMVYYGAGGSGHWGVEIGPPERPLPNNTPGRRYTAWAPGICFFNGQ